MKTTLKQLADKLTLTPISIREAQQQARQLHVLPALEVRMLLEHVLQKSHAWLVAHDDEVLTPTQTETFQQRCAQRASGEPLAYLIGWREFYGRRFQVTPDVLIPRPETELLVSVALEKVTALNGLKRPAHVIDLGTGSGAIAITLALETRAKIAITATDISPAALDIATANAARLEAKVNFIQSDWWQAVPQRAFDLILSNPPYIRAGDSHLTQGDLRFEPSHALTDHADGLSAYRTLCAGLTTYLAPGGWVLFEHGYDQAPAVQDLLRAQGLQAVQTWPDLAGIPRVTGGRAAQYASETA